MKILILAHDARIASRLVSAASLLGDTITVFCLDRTALPALRELAGISGVLQADIHPLSATTWAQSLQDLAREYDHVLGAETEQTLLAMLGALLQRPVLTQVCEIIGTATIKRTSYAGQFMASIQAPGGLFAIQAGAFPPCANGSTPAEITTLALPVPAEKQCVIASNKMPRRNLDTAKVVLGGGKGMGDRDSFTALITPLAQRLQAEIGGTRSAAEAGMIEHAAQIGQTGQHIAPRIYLAVGISGAAQHVAGIRRSGLIIAINPDPDAPIFKVADYGWLAKAQEALPALEQSLAARGV